MISLDTLKVEATILVGDQPYAMVLTPDGSHLYVANLSSGNVSVIDTSSRSVIRTVPVGDWPSPLTVSRDGRHVYVVNSGSSSVSVIATASNTVEATVPTPPGPSAIAYHPVRDELWLAGNTVPGTVLTVLSSENYSTLASLMSSTRLYGGGLQFTPDGSELFATESCGCCGRFHRLSGVHSNGTIRILQQDLFSGGNWAVGVAVHPSNGTAYFAQQGHCSTPPTPRISELGGANRRLSLIQPPQALAVTPDGDRLCIVGTNSLRIVDLATFATVTNIGVGARAHGIAVGRKPAEAPTISRVEPYLADASTVLLDHFDGTSGANILAFANDGNPCGNARPSATPNYSFGPGPAGLDRAITLAAPAGAPAGSRTYLKYPGGELLSQRNGTLECWVYLATYDLYIHQLDYVGECQGDVGGLSITPAGQLRGDIWYTIFDPFDFDSGTNTVPLNAWTHVALSWGGTGAKMYINGTLVGAHPNTGSFASWFGSDSVFVFLGSSNHLDELRISSIQRTNFNLPTLVVLTNISVAPANPIISTLQTEQFAATGFSSDGIPWSLSAFDGLIWSSSDLSVAMIGAGGMATPTAQGRTEITATVGALSAHTTLRVTNVPPIVITPPMDQTVRPGSKATWCVVVEGSEPMTFRWQRNGADLPGATGGCLTLSNASPANAGLYSLVISNPFGTNTVQAALSLMDLKMFAGLIITGPPGNYRIDALENLGGTNTWTTLDTIPVSQEQMPFYYFDTNSPSHRQRFYRAVWQP